MGRSYWRTVSLVTLWQVAASICYYSVFAATPFLRDAFGLSRLSVGVVVTVISLGYAVFLLPLGAVVDRFGERRTLVLGLLGLAVATALVAGAPTYALLLASVFLLGSLYGTAMPGTNKAIFVNVELERRNLAMGIKQVGVTAGSGISALLVTGLAGVLFWQAGFIVAAAFAAIVAVGFYGAYSSSFDGGTAKYPDFRALLSNRPFVLLSLAGLFLGSAFFTTTGYTVLYMEESIGVPVEYAGAVLAVVQLFGSAGRVVVGWLADALPAEPKVRIGSILIVQSTIGAAMFVVVSQTTTVIGATVAFAGLGFFVLGSTGVYYSEMATLVRAEEMGGATAGGQLMLTSGSLFAPPAFGYLADTVGYRGSWLLLAGLMTVAVALLIAVVRVPTQVARPATARD